MKEVPKIIKINAVKGERGFEHFGIHHSLASMYGNKPEDIFELQMKISDDQTVPPANEKNMDADYWGYFDYEDNRFSLVYPKYFLLNVCFPYGITANEEKNQGKAYRLEIIGIF